MVVTTAGDDGQRAGAEAAATEMTVSWEPPMRGEALAEREVRGRGDTRPAVVTAPPLTRAAKRRLEATQSAAAGKQLVKRWASTGSSCKDGSEPAASQKDDGRAQEVAAKTAVNPPRAKPKDDGRAPEVAAKTAVNPERADLKDDGRARKVAAETAVKPARAKPKDDGRAQEVAAKTAVNPPRAKPKDDGRAQEVAAKTAVNPPQPT
ncbi:hypothetical protein GN958_ATG07646 [Phytophthora infestans]|uniref:Uncharacterized protein n=1 Tax=Phytophthora infestans TaxID=4787 RepID=A0A8S9URS7_PHYIN|nr:hypothetical protein GN958_ATG07646 [Phytophthora infestans]